MSPRPGVSGESAEPPTESPADPFAGLSAVPAGQLTGVMLHEVDDVPVAQTVMVNHDNVLRAAKIIQGVLDDERASILGELDKLRVVAPGDDLVSAQAARAWNDRLLDAQNSYAKRVGEYLDGLTQLVENLVGTARRYGYSEQQITDMLNAVDAR